MTNRISSIFTLAILALALVLSGCDLIDGLTKPDEEGASSDGVYLFPVRISNEYGFVNQNGRMMIEPDFSWADGFYEGVARIWNGSSGYINPDGTYLIEPRFQTGRRFTEGLAAVEVDGRWGFVNKSGAFAINPQFREAFSFYEGRAFVLMPNFEWEYIDATGQVIRTLETPELEDMENVSPNFQNGRAIILDFNTDQFGYIDRDGNVAIAAQYAEARPFSDGLAAIKISDSWGFIDSDNTTRISPRFIEAGDFSEGLVPARENTNTWGYFDKSGRQVIEPQFEEARSFHNGVAAVMQDGFWAYVDRSGNLLTEFDFDEASDFHKGVGRVTISILNPDSGERTSRWGYIGTDGKYVWYPTD